MEISLSVPVGSILAVTGPSGSGKTTFLRQLAGLAQPRSGHIKFGEQLWLNTESAFNLPVQNRRIGFVFQDYALFPHWSVRANLSFALDKGAGREVIDELLQAVDLVELADRKPHQLSGGQQQRVSLARALVRKPDLLLLDEPLSALDHSLRASLQDLLLRFHRKFGFTMIIVTHDLGEIFRLSNQVIIIEDGKILKQGTPAEVYLSDQDISEGIIIYGEVLSCQKQKENLLLRALIGQHIKEIYVPLHMADDLLPGKSFALRYNPGDSDIMLIKN
ncbi:ABC transporter ATP-binding protein [Dyadobacter psychrotolerans]|uniref:ABC transporter ATP-binding protein n=2 Tax=Dyadobacter psychrotolerans TaxID=2541721 RepID=A0A4R5DLN4_9BACT|nr:ABC transporter ATP-binding protein [Dyadobacter psychrotolerans]